MFSASALKRTWCRRSGGASGPSAPITNFILMSVYSPSSFLLQVCLCCEVSVHISSELTSTSGAYKVTLHITSRDFITFSNSLRRQALEQPELPERILYLYAIGAKEETSDERFLT
jgi:hypothetical protein